MNLHAIYHITDVPYAYAEDENNLFIMIRTGKKDVKGCRLFYKDRYDWENPFNVKNMELRNRDNLFDYFETVINLEKNRYRYFFELEGWDGNILYYNERGFHGKSVCEAGAFEFPYIASADVYNSPSWAREGIVYQIFPDRFCNGDKSNDPSGVKSWGDDVTTASMFGGDLEGIINKLDYLKELGITIIYLTPIFLSTTNHKYNTCDYYKIDPHFGDIDTVKRLVKNAHERGIKIILDAVFNHSGSDFFAFLDVVKNQEKSKYKDWYFINEFPVSIEKINYETFADNVSIMPKLNTSNPDVREYLLDVSEFWIKEVGIDGWRLDVCDEVDHFFWREFRKRVKDANREAFIIGEICHEASSFLKGEQLDSIMNYPFRDVMIDYFAKRKITADEMIYELSSKRALYMKKINMNMLNLLGSHDRSRFLTECDNHVERLKLAAAFQYTYIGIPYIYYGDEVGLSGGHDPECRRCMEWDEKRQNRELLNYYKALNKIRKENKVLIYGDFINVCSKGSITEFKRVNNEDVILVILNNCDEENFLKSEDIKGDYINLFTGEKINIFDSIVLKPNDIKILKLCRE